MNKYFHGFMPSAEGNKNSHTSAKQNYVPVSADASDINNQNGQLSPNNQNTSANNPLYPTNNNPNQNTNFQFQNNPDYISEQIKMCPRDIENFNNNLANSITQNPHASAGTNTSETNMSGRNADDVQNRLPYAGKGSLIVQAFTANQAIPLENVKITITSEEPQISDINEVKYTDSSGRTESVSLPAPSLFLSQQSQNMVKPYATYKINYELNGYTANNLPREAVVFDEIESIQNLELIPIRKNDNN